MTKALGLQSGLSNQFRYFNSFSMVGPAVRSDESLNFYRDANWTSYLALFTPFDSLIHTTPVASILQRCMNNFACFTPQLSDSVSTVASKLEPFLLQNYSRIDLKQLRKNQTLVGQYRKLYRMFDQEKAELRFSDGSTMLIDKHTFGYSSIRLAPSPEFLTSVYNAYTNFNGLHQQISKYKVKNIYGPKTIKFFQEIGYSTRIKGQRIDLTYTERDLQFMDDWKTADRWTVRR